MERSKGEGSNLGNTIRTMCKMHDSLQLAMQAQMMKAQGYTSREIADRLNRKQRQVFYMLKVDCKAKMREIIGMLKPYPRYRLPADIEKRLGITPNVENGRVTYSIASA